MNLEKLEKYLVLYLKENDIDYDLKDKIYTIEFTKENKNIYGKELKATFDKKIAEKHKIHLIENGSFLIENISEKYSEKFIYSNLKLEKKESDWEELEEKELELNKKDYEKNVEETSKQGLYILFELIFTSSKEKRKILVPIMHTDQFISKADDFEENNFKVIEEKFEIKNEINDSIDKIEILIKDKIEMFEKTHYENLNDLSKIVIEHSEQKYKELQNSEDKIRNELQKLRTEIIKATTFKKKQTLTDKQKQSQKKLDNTIKKNQDKRAVLKKEHDFELEAIKNREYSVHAKVKMITKVDFPMYKLSYTKSNKTSIFYYLPCLKKIIKKDGTDAVKQEIEKEKEIVINEKSNEALEKKVEETPKKSKSFLDQALEKENKKPIKKEEKPKKKKEIISFI